LGFWGFEGRRGSAKEERKRRKKTFAEREEEWVLKKMN